MTFKQQVEFANSRGVGQLHIFVAGQYARMSWRSFNVAKSSADRHGGCVVNDSGEIVYRANRGG
jgi:hypothetical protein